MGTPVKNIVSYIPAPPTRVRDPNSLHLVKQQQSLKTPTLTRLEVCLFFFLKLNAKPCWSFRDLAHVPKHCLFMRPQWVFYHWTPHHLPTLPQIRKPYPRKPRQTAYACWRDIVFSTSSLCIEGRPEACSLQTSQSWAGREREMGKAKPSSSCPTHWWWRGVALSRVLGKSRRKGRIIMVEESKDVYFFPSILC